MGVMARAHSNTSQVWTTRKLLAGMGDAVTKAEPGSPRLCAEMLVSHVIGCERLKLYIEPDRPAAPLEKQSLRELTARALKGEPVQYLVGQGWFFSMPFYVDERVLIPRPASATIVEEVLQHARVTPGFGAGEGERFGRGVLLADICTGSGCIGIALARNMPGVHVIATDISKDAIAVATKNAQQHEVIERMDLLCGNLLEPLDVHPVARLEHSLHYLVANPPYIPDDEWDSADEETGVQTSVKDFEPTIALRGGTDGLDFVRPILEEGTKYLMPGGLLLVEVAASRAEAARELAEKNPDLERVRILKDYEGLARTIVAQRKAT